MSIVRLVGFLILLDDVAPSVELVILSSGLVNLGGVGGFGNSLGLLGIRLGFSFAHHLLYIVVLGSGILCLSSLDVTGSLYPSWQFLTASFMMYCCLCIMRCSLLVHLWHVLSSV